MWNINYGLIVIFNPCRFTLKTKAHNTPRSEKKTRNLTVIRFVVLLIYLNEYFTSFPRAIFFDKIDLTELNEFLLNSMHNSWYKQDYVQGFDCEHVFLGKLLTCLSKWRFLNLFTKV